jgi:hypothetical protein
VFVIDNFLFYLVRGLRVSVKWNPIHTLLLSIIYLFI